MNKPKKRFSFHPSAFIPQLSSLSPLLTIFLPILLLLILYLFWDAIVGIPHDISLWSMDGSPLYDHDFKMQTWRELTGRAWNTTMLGMPGRTRVFQPDDLMKFIFPPLVYHLMSWIGAFLLMTGAMLYFLYSYGLKGLKAAIPALAFGFSGYTFTLMSAGHRATPMTMGYAVLAMALVRNGIRKNTITHLVAAGLACVYGIINQQDVMGFLMIIIAAYALLQLILALPTYGSSKKGTASSPSEPQPSPDQETTPSSAKPRQAPILRLLAAILLAATTFLIVAYPFLDKTFFGGDNGRSTMEYRQDQIKRAGGDQWEFITDWSLPPEGVLEFIAPSIFGRENTSREVPYWGRLGQSMDWPETKKGFRNFRQHNLYIGGIQIVLALYALFFLFRRGPNAPPRDRRIEIAFWWTVTLLTLLLAFGRYFPLYRLIFHIPVLNNIRCPVKWFHVTEISIVVLMAFGLHALWQDLRHGRTHLPRRFAIGTAVVAGLLLLASGLAQATGWGMQSIWAAHGLTPIAGKLRAAMAGSLLHGALVFTALSAIIFFALQRTGRASRPGEPPSDQVQSAPPYAPLRLCARFSPPLAILLAVLAIDLATAHKPFVHVRDVSAYYAPNPIADIILNQDQPYRLADYLSSRNMHDPLYRNFLLKGVDMLLPRPGQRIPDDVKALFDSTKDNPLRLWQLTSTRFIIGQRKQFAKLLQHPAIKLRAGLNVTSQARIVLDHRHQSPFVLLEYMDALPPVQLYHSWETATGEDSVLRRLADFDFDPTQNAIVTGNVPEILRSTTAPTAAQNHNGTPGILDVHFPKPATGLLVYTSQYNEHIKASCGTPMKCNAGFFAALLDDPTQRLSITIAPTASVFWSGVSHAIILLALAAMSLRCKAQRYDQQESQNT